MRTHLPLVEMLRHEKIARGSARFGGEVFVLDANAFKYSYGGELPEEVVVTDGVMTELRKYPHIFPEESVGRLARLLNPSVVTPFVSSENEFEIYRASVRLPKDARRAANSGLGWVDTQQLSYAMDLARAGKDVALVSNDADFRNALNVLGQRFPEVGEKVFCLSTRKYLERTNPELLRGLNRHFRSFILYELDQEHRLAS